MLTFLFDLDTAFVRRKITTNDSQEENIDACHRNRELIYENPPLDFPDFSANNIFFTNKAVVLCIYCSYVLSN